MTPDKDPHQKPPVVKPTLRDLATIPLQESQWYMLGQALGLQENLLDLIQMGSSNLTRRRREMFKSWLEEKPDNVSWGTLLSSLRAIGAADVAENVRKVYEISSGSDSEEILSDQDEIDAGFVEVCTIVTSCIHLCTVAFNLAGEYFSSDVCAFKRLPLRTINSNPALPASQLWLCVGQFP